ncbi:hypothetical protein BDF22DRAFT_661903 [Syncephalis plumigaleata]|nr:hypothetical protein BDF22DRAFT_661903 [Syncephalis plumigaleata]
MNNYLLQQGVQLVPDTYCIRKLSGDTAFTSDPLATALLANETNQRCHTCFQIISPTSKQDNEPTNDTVNALCGGCRYARYCNTASWPHHRFECRYRQQQQSLPSTRHLGNDPELLLLFRTCHILLSSNRREIYRSLPHHRLEHTAWSLDRYGQMADTLLRMAPFTQSSAYTKSGLIDEQLDDRYYPVGVGVYPMASLLNHSCRPNCTYRFDGVQLQVVARQSIRPGEELTISYIDWIYGPVERRQYYFKCQCPRCLDGESKDPLDRLLRHRLTLMTDLVSIDDWVVKQMTQSTSPLLQMTRNINKWYTTLNATDNAVGTMFSRTILELVGSFMNDQLAKAVYLLVYGRYHPLVPLECLWNKMDIDASQRVIELLEIMPLLLARTHPNARTYHMPIYEQYKQLMEKARRE